MDTRNPGGVTSALTTFSDRIGYVMEGDRFKKRREEEWAIGTSTHTTKSNSRDCYLVSVFYESPDVRGRRPRGHAMTSVMNYRDRAPSGGDGRASESDPSKSRGRRGGRTTRGAPPPPAHAHE
ncbi:hypothetical protein EVAR_12768_1 [Eumeta japonica]|uniref:Uncharacterized protein n=1 Tax=Eumeta variegata TaxID=151549 RepID=A0A4C1UAX4_EUMVA|nr:hypothetical protein EVAR_12768_1 [Eumeta japonica]